MDTKKLRQMILDLAIRGKLVPQDPNDEPASVLLERIRAEKERLIKEGKIKRSKKTVTDDVIEAPFEIPEGWEWCRLDDLAFYKKGPFGSSLTKSMFVPDAPSVYKVYEQKNAINKDATLGHYFIDREKYEELKGFAVLPSDIIVSCAGTIGETYILPQGIREGIINQALMLIRLYDTSITYFYLLYFDYILKNEAAKESKGTAIKNIPPFEVLKNFQMPIPPLAEQQRIANEVERWFTLIDALESNEGDLLKAIDQAKSKILDLAIHGKLVSQDPNDEPAIELLKRINPKFEPCDSSLYCIPKTWNWCRMQDVITFINGRAYKREELLDKGKYKVLRVGNFFTNDSWYYSDMELPEDKYCYKDDLLYAWSASFGPKIWDGDKTIFHYHIWNVKYDKCILYRDYLYYFFLVDKEKIISSTTGSTMIHVSMENMKPRLIPLPPLNEQKRIVTKIEELFAILDSIKESLK